MINCTLVLLSIYNLAELFSSIAVPVNRRGGSRSWPGHHHRILTSTHVPALLQYRSRDLTRPQRLLEDLYYETAKRFDKKRILFLISDNFNLNVQWLTLAEQQPPKSAGSGANTRVTWRTYSLPNRWMGVQDNSHRSCCTKRSRRSMRPNLLQSIARGGRSVKMIII